MLKRVLCISGLIMLIAGSGCKKSATVGQAAEQDTSFDVLSLNREGVIDYEIKTVKSKVVDPRSPKKILADVHIKYPELTYANNNLKYEVTRFVNSYIEALLKEHLNSDDTAKVKSIKTAAAAFANTCKDNMLALRKVDPDFDQVWFCDVVGNVEMQSDRFFTLRFKHNLFTGGAHGDYGEYYCTFNIGTGKVLSWSDVLQNREKFIALAEKRFRQVNSIPESTKLTEEEGFLFENNQFQLSDNFGFTSDGLIVYYEPYQAAPYSFGSTTLLFKYFEVMELLNPTLFEEPL